MAFNVHHPADNDGKPQFLQNLKLLTSETILPQFLNNIYDGKILGTTTKGNYVSVYVFIPQLNGYVSRSYRYLPHVNAKGELYKILSYFNMLNANGFDGLNGRSIKVKLYYSTGKDRKTYNLTRDNFIYVNYTVKFDNVQTQIPQNTQPQPQPQQPIQNRQPSPDSAFYNSQQQQPQQNPHMNDLKQCPFCGKKVSNYALHLEAMVNYQCTNDYVVG